MTISPEINVDIKKSLPSCMKTATVTKGSLSGTDKGRAAIIEGKKKSCYKMDRISKQKKKTGYFSKQRGKQGGFYEPYKV